MRIRTLVCTAIMAMTISHVSAEVELLFHFGDGNFSHYAVIERSKKLFILDDDENTKFDIKEYKRNGNIETFTLKAREKGYGMDFAHVTTTLDAEGHTLTIQYKEPNFFGGMKYEVKTTSPAGERNQNRLLRYFNELNGNPTEQGVVETGGGESTAAPHVSKPNEPQAPATPESPAGKVKGAAKEAARKVKGVFKKK